MLLSISEPTMRLTRRSLLISSASAGALLAMPGSRFSQLALAGQTPTASTGVFLDPARVHDISATFDQTAYDAMIDTYSESGDKEWLSATMTIDGQTFEQVGMRLKGNSSIMGLREGFGPPEGGQGGPSPERITIDPGVDGTPTAEDGLNTFVGGPGGNVSADEPQGLPWLVRLDRNIDDQNFNGLYEFVIRSNHTKTALNEALSLELLAEAGLASQAAAYVRFSTNDSEPRLRVAIENPDDLWLAAHFSEDGTLFKAEAEGDWSYRGDDWESYVIAFDLEAGGGDDDAENYAPLISFLDFINNSDDAAFVAELPSRLDIEQFAVYKAMMLLLNNGDDISGPGNNAYLYYDHTASMFTVVPWDMNLALGGMMGGPGGPGFQTGPGGEIDRVPGEGALVIINGTPVAGDAVVQGPRGTSEGANGARGGPGGIGGMNNPLVIRWDADTGFAALQTATQERLKSELFESGTAAEILARWVAVLETHATDLVDPSTIDSESQSLQEQINAA